MIMLEGEGYGAQVTHMLQHLMDAQNLISLLHGARYESLAHPSMLHA